MQRIHTDRSRIETFQRCNRLRFLEYHDQGTGIVPAKKALALCVGGSVHKGLEVLLREGSSFHDKWVNNWEGNIPTGIGYAVASEHVWTQVGAWREIEEQAVTAALADFHQHSSALALDLTEQAAMQQSGMQQPDYLAQMAQSLGTTVEDVGVGALAERVQASQSDFERYLASEQAALVEAMVRAYARRRLRPLLEQFEVLEVEREGEWKLSEWGKGTVCEDCSLRLLGRRTEQVRCPQCGGTSLALDDEDAEELWFMSRPDALLRERQSNQLFILSFKTTGSWDIRKERDAQHDMQGLSEGVEVERRLGEWWDWCKDLDPIVDKLSGGPDDWDIYYAKDKETTPAMIKYLRSCGAPPRILGIRYEYLLKGDRWKDKDLSARFGMEVRSQRSHLIRQYVATSVPVSKKGPAPFNHGDTCWSWDYIRAEDQKSSTLAWQNWSGRPVFEGIEAHNADEWGKNSIKVWIDRLDAAEVVMSGEDSTVGLAPRVLGWKSPAQAMGYTVEHPLDSVFVPPIIVYRQDDELRDWVEQIEGQEVRVAKAVSEVNAATDEGEKRHLFNVYFPQTRKACEYPTTCAMVKLCYGAEDLRRDPIGSGLYTIRIPNHPMENNSSNK